MAYATIYLTNGIEIKKAPVGFSWTTFFFGGWPAIFRQDWLWGVLGIIGSILTWGISGIVCSFIYNKVYIKNLINNGYKVVMPSMVNPDQLKAYLGFVNLPTTE